MTEIQTNSFSMTPAMYFKIVAKTRLKRYWWLYLGCFLIACMFLPDFGAKDLATFMVIMGFFYPPFLFVYLYFWTTSSKNKAVFVKKQLTINNEKILATLVDNINNEIPFSYIQNVIETNEYWLLYVTASQFLYIPKTVFRTTADLNKFEEIIQSLKDQMNG